MTSNQEIKAEISKDHKIELEVSLLKSLDNVLKPFVFLIDDFKIKKGQLKVLQQEIFKFLIDPAII